MSIFDVMLVKKEEKETLKDETKKRIEDIETALKQIDPATSPYATATLQTELERLKKVV